MNICILGNAQSPHIRRWAKFFTARGHEVTIVSSRPGELDGVRIHVPNLPFEARLRRRQTFDEDRTPNFAVYLSYFILALTIRSVLKRLSPDIVMAMTMETNGVLSMISGHHPTALFPLGHKALSIASEKSLVVRLLVKAMIRFADMLYPGDSAGVDRLLELGASREKIYVNPWGVDLDHLPSRAEAQQLRKRLGPVDKKLFVSMRVLLPEYDVSTFVRAVPEIVAAYPDTRYVVVGGGPQENELKKLAKELGIADHVTFVGHAPYDKLLTYLAAADFYVDPVNYPLPTGRTWWGHQMRCSMAGNGYSITLLMALATGCIPLVTRRSGLSDIFDVDDQRLILWEPGNPNDLAEKAKHLLSSETECDEIQAKVLELARERFDWQRNARLVEKDYLAKIEEFRR